MSDKDPEEPIDIENVFSKDEKSKDSAKLFDGIENIKSDNILASDLVGDPPKSDEDAKVEGESSGKLPPISEMEQGDLPSNLQSQNTPIEPTIQQVDGSQNRDVSEDTIKSVDSSGADEEIPVQNRAMDHSGTNSVESTISTTPDDPGEPSTPA